RRLRLEVAGVGLELHAGGAQLLEGVAEQEVLGLGVEAGPLPRLAQPGAADLQAAVPPTDVQVGGDAHGPATRLLDLGEEDDFATGLLLEPAGDVFFHAGGRVGRVDRHPAPDVRVDV